MDVTALVQRWSDGQANWGVAILPEIVTGNDDGISIWTSEASNGMIRPRLEVTFEREIEPPTRPEDLDGDGVVGVSDLILLLSAWGMTDSPFDLDGTGSVGEWRPHLLDLRLGLSPFCSYAQGVGSASPN